ncbi:MAG: methionyl-tRNA formyltransferase [Candidatus Tectomicrobia bacterium]|nr:methionyl-tRNA formyltransferase [Candidatus Tectomicrobia bacterium]
MAQEFRIVLFGSGEVTALCLDQLLERGAAVTGLVVSAQEGDVDADLLTLAEAMGIPTQAPADLRSRQFLAWLRHECRADIIFSIAYQHRLPPEVLRLPRLGALNWHPSLLPLHRGPDPYFWALHDGDLETGLTIHLMEETFDSGDIVLQHRLPILVHDTWGTLARRLDVVAVEMVREVMDLLEAHPTQLPRRPQGVTAMAYQRRPSQNDFNINWHGRAQAIVNLVRACNPNVGARTRFRDGVLFVFKACLSPVPSRLLEEWRKEGRKALPGKVLATDSAGLVVQAGDHAVRLEIVQRDADYLLGGRDFACIERVQAGEVMEELRLVSSEL